MSQYPQSLEAALGLPLRFPPATLKAVRAFAASKPWRGSFEERQTKFRQIHADLARIYQVNPMLVIAGDDRVHPGHARKMAARLEETGHEVLYYENTEGGHAAAANHEQRARMEALDYAFLWMELSR